MPSRSDRPAAEEPRRSNKFTLLIPNGDEISISEWDPYAVLSKPDIPGQGRAAVHKQPLLPFDSFDNGDIAVSLSGGRVLMMRRVKGKYAAVALLDSRTGSPVKDNGPDAAAEKTANLLGDRNLLRLLDKPAERQEGVPSGYRHVLDYRGCLPGDQPEGSAGVPAFASPFYSLSGADMLLGRGLKRLQPRTFTSEPWSPRSLSSHGITFRETPSVQTQLPSPLQTAQRVLALLPDRMQLKCRAGELSLEVPGLGSWIRGTTNEAVSEDLARSLDALPRFSLKNSTFAAHGKATVTLGSVSLEIDNPSFTAAPDPQNPNAVLLSGMKGIIVQSSLGSGRLESLSIGLDGSKLVIRPGKLTLLEESSSRPDPAAKGAKAAPFAPLAALAELGKKAGGAQRYVRESALNGLSSLLGTAQIELPAEAVPAAHTAMKLLLEFARTPEKDIRAWAAQQMEAAGYPEAAGIAAILNGLRKDGQEIKLNLDRTSVLAAGGVSVVLNPEISFQINGSPRRLDLHGIRGIKAYPRIDPAALQSIARFLPDSVLIPALSTPIVPYALSLRQEGRNCRIGMHSTGLMRSLDLRVGRDFNPAPDADGLWRMRCSVCNPLADRVDFPFVLAFDKENNPVFDTGDGLSIAAGALGQAVDHHAKEVVSRVTQMHPGNVTARVKQGFAERLREERDAVINGAASLMRGAVYSLTDYALGRLRPF